jgi:protein-L-isoaspartate(D-aspartate) O-methyltransferase
MRSNKELINEIKFRANHYLDDEERNSHVLEAMLGVDRINFLPQNEKQYAYNDNPVSIGHGQTCSQPSMVAFMLDKLEIMPGNSVLEIGAGCGYASAVASLLCKPGMVFASEIIPELADIMRYNLAGYSENIMILSADGSAGFAEYSPYDRIFISAGVKSNLFDTSILLEQIAEGGVLLYPENYGNLYKFKKRNGKILKETYYGVSFVPLTGKNS